VLAPFGEVLVQVARDQNGRVVGLGCLLQLRCHVNVGREVTRIDFVETAQSSLDRLPLVQAEAHFDLVVGHALVQSGMVRILLHLSGAFGETDNLQEADEAHIAELRHFI